MTAITAGSFLKALHAGTLHVGNRRLQYHRAENRFGGQQSGAALDRKLNKRKRRAEDHNEGNRLATTLLMMSGTLYEGQYRHAGREGECPHTQIAVIVDGGKAGTVLHVCAEEKCKIHRQVSHYQISPKEKEQRRKLALAIRVQKESRSRILQAVRQKLPPEVARTDFEMVALDYFRRLGHDNHHRLFQIYGCVVVCSLVPDLHCPGYNSAETLSKEANLMRTAARYRVDALKITTRVSAELSAKRRLAGDRPRPAASRRKRQTGKTR